MKLIRASATRLSRIWCAVLGAVPATVPAKRRSIVRCRWPHRIRSIWGWRATISASPAALSRPKLSHVSDARREWRVMHQDHGRPIELRRECSVEPTQSLGAQHPAMLTGHERVERDKPYWVIFDRELQVALGRQVAGVPKSLAQRLSGIMIAGDYEDRHRQGCQQIPQLFVFVRLAVIDEIAGHDGDIGPWHQRV